MFISDTESDISKGDKVKIISGKFTGFSGFVCRVKRQTRVGVTINGFGTIVTAYVPKAFYKKSQNSKEINYIYSKYILNRYGYLNR